MLYTVLLGKIQAKTSTYVIRSVTVVWESVGYKMVDLAPTVNVEGYKYRSFGYRHVLKVTRYVGGISQLGYQTKSGMI